MAAVEIAAGHWAAVVVSVAVVLLPEMALVV